MFPSLMHIVRISPCYFLNWRLPGVSEAIYQCGSVCYLHILVIIQYCQFATKADYSGPGSPARASQQPPVLHLSARGPQLSLFSLLRPGPRSAQRGAAPGPRPGAWRAGGEAELHLRDAELRPEVRLVTPGQAPASPQVRDLFLTNTGCDCQTRHKERV